MLAFLKRCLASLLQGWPRAQKPARSARRAQVVKTPTSPAKAAPAAVAQRGHREATRRRRLEADASNEGAEPASELSIDIERRIEIGDFDLPHLPSTNMSIIELLSRPSADVAEVSAAIAKDPVLSSELLKTANSALYAGTAQAATLGGAIMRMGLKGVRRMLLELSVREVLFRDRELSGYAEEVWRDAFAAGTLARAMGGTLGFDQEQSFMLGLLHDVGKIALLEMLRKEVRLGRAVDDRIVGTIFARFHERAGTALAKRWKLSEEIVSVAGCHERFADNPTHPREAALAKLAHEFDVAFSTADSHRVLALYHSAEIKALSGNPEMICRVQAAVEAAWEAMQEPAPT